MMSMISVRHPGDVFVSLYRKMNMLFDQIIRMGYIVQMVKEFPPNFNHGSYLIVPQCNQDLVRIFRQRYVYVGSDPPK